MTSDELKTRTKRFALSVIRLGEVLPKSKVSDIIYGQLVRAATSIGANYRAACRARSHADFISKIGIVEEESDETQYWLELLADSDILKREKLSPLIMEADELTRIFTSSGKTAKSNRPLQKSALRSSQSQIRSI